MSNYEEVQVPQPERDKIIESFYKQISEWGLTMPQGATTLVMDFGLKRFFEVGETELWIANERENGYCGKFVYVLDGQTCPFHRHKMKHETFYMVKGEMCMKMEDKDIIMKQGDVLVMPPNVGHSFTGIGPALILEVSMPSIIGDNFFADKNIGDDGVI